MSAKQIEIVNKLSSDFSEGQASRPELMEWAEKNGYSKYAPSFIWQKPYRVGRGMFRIPSESELGSVKSCISHKISPEVLADKAAEVSAPEPAHANLMMSTDIEQMVPQKFEGFVPWGHFKDIKSIIKSKIFYPMFVTGLSGNGKTLNVSQACAELNRECVRVNVTIETDEDDLIGGFRLVDGETKFNLGPVAIAMERGAVLLLDEIDLASNKIMCLQPVLEGNGIYIKKINRYIKPAPGFTVIATANTKGKGSDDGRFIGTNILNEAFLERFPVTLEQPYPTTATEKKIVIGSMEKYGKVDEEYADRLVTWAEVIRKSFYDGAVDELISTRRLDHIVKAFAIFGDRMKAIELCVNRFDEDTKASFMDLYSKVDEDVKVPMGLEEVSEKEESEIPF